MKSQPKTLMDSVKEGRTVVEMGKASSQSALTVFLGLFNAEPFFAQIEENLLSQSQFGIHWLIVDNNSSDGSWEFAQSLATRLEGRVTLVKNHINIGGTGSLISSLELAEGTWLATLHQDDAYYPNHLDQLKEIISSSTEKTVMVTTSMDTLKYKGSKGNPAPRANLILQEKTSLDVFLAHLRFHALPFPAAAFMVDALKEVPLAWHDNSFPDTELVCKLAARGTFRTSSVVTMAYRENPLSESHILPNAERHTGQMLGLLRLFGSEEFKTIAHSISIRERDAFFDHAAVSVTIRLGDSPEASLVSRFLADVLSIEWNYSSVSASSHLLEEPDISAESFTATFLHRSINNVDLRGSRGTGLVEFVRVLPRREKWYHTRALTPLFRFALVLLGRTKIRRDIDFHWRRK